MTRGVAEAGPGAPATVGAAGTAGRVPIGAAATRAGWRERSVPLAALGFWVAFFGPSQVLLAVAAERLATGPKELVFGPVSAVGSLVLLVTYPLVGRLSDAWGGQRHRRALLVVGTAVVSIGLLLCGAAGGPVALGAAWAVASAGLACVQCGFETTFAWEVAPARRARVAGLLGGAQMAGALVGSAIATAAGGGAPGFTAVAAVMVLLVTPLVVTRSPKRSAGVGTDATRRSEPAPPRGPRRPGTPLLLAWAGRFLVLFGLGCVTQFLLYYVSDHLGADDPQATMLLLTTVFVTGAASSAVVTGRLVPGPDAAHTPALVGALLAGAALVGFGALDRVPLVSVAALVFGVGLGMFLGTIFAVITDHLPDPARYGRDLGLLNAAVVLPQVAAPVAAVWILEVDGSYGTLFRVAGALIVVGGIAVFLVGRVGRVEAPR